MHSYSVAALVLTLKPGQTNTQCYRVIQLRNVSIQQEGLKEEILTEIKSDIGEFSHLIDCHGVCGNNNKVSFVTNLLVESVWQKMQFFMCLVVSSSRLLFAFHVFSFTPALSVTCIGDIFVHISTCHLSTGYVTWPTSKC